VTKDKAVSSQVPNGKEKRRRKRAKRKQQNSFLNGKQTPATNPQIPPLMMM